MAKKVKAPMVPKLGNKKDGARTSKKSQTTALIPQNKMGKGGGRAKRMAKMEKSDVPV